MEWAVLWCRFLLVVILHSVTAVVNDYYNGQACGQSGHTVHIDRDGGARCCLERNCAKGTVGQLCNRTHAASSQCVPCPENQFMPSVSHSSDMLPCIQRRHCPSKRGLTIKINGTLVSNNVCKCNLERGYWDSMKLENPKTCWFEECDIGHELTEDGCKPCKPGMFKKDSGIEMCSHWTDCGAIGLSYGPNGNTTYDPGCVNNTIRLSTGASTHRDSNDNYNKAIIMGSVTGAVVILVLVIVISLSCRKHHSENTGRPEQPSAGVEGGTSSQPYEVMDVNGIQTEKASFERLQSSPEYKEPNGQTIKEEANSESVEEYTQPYDDDKKMPNNTSLSATVPNGRDQQTVININAVNLNLQMGDRNDMDITQ